MFFARDFYSWLCVANMWFCLNMTNCAWWGTVPFVFLMFLNWFGTTNDGVFTHFPRGVYVLWNTSSKLARCQSKGKCLCQHYIKVLLCGLHSVMKWETRLIFQQGVINGEAPCNFPGFSTSRRVDDNQYDKCHQYNGSFSSNSPVKQYSRKPDNTATKWLFLQVLFWITAPSSHQRLPSLSSV